MSIQIGDLVEILDDSTTVISCKGKVGTVVDIETYKGERIYLVGKPGSAQLGFTIDQIKLLEKR